MVILINIYIIFSIFYLYPCSINQYKQPYFTMIMLIIFISQVWLSIGQDFKPPDMTENGIINTSTNFGNIKNFSIQGDYFLRLSDTYKLDIWNSQNESYIYSFKCGIGILSVCSQYIKDFQLKSLTMKLYLLASTYFYQIDLNNQTLLRRYYFGDRGIAYQIQVTSKKVYLINQKEQIWFFSLTDFSVYDKFGSSLGSSSQKFQSCQTTSNVLLSAWSIYSRQINFNCSGSTCQQLTQYYSQSSGSNGWFISNVDFSPDCSKIVVQRDNFKGTFVYNVKTSSLQKLYPLLGMSIYSSYFFDSGLNQILLFMSNGTALIYDTTSGSTTNYKGHYTLADINMHSRYDINKQRIVIATNTTITKYNLNCPTGYFSSTSGFCSVCPTACSGTCTGCTYPSNTTTTNTTNTTSTNTTSTNTTSTNTTSTNTTSNATTTNTTTTNTTSNATTTNTTTTNTTTTNTTTTNTTTTNTTTTNTTTTNTTTTNTTNFPQNLNNIIGSNSNSYILPIFQSQAYLTQNLKNILTYVTQGAKYIVFLLTVTPLSAWFLQFINFWSIISFYRNLNATMPNYLYKMIQFIYQSFNSVSPLTTFINQYFNITVEDTHLTKKYIIQSDNTEEQIQIDFLKLNFDSFSKFFVSGIFLVLLILVRNYLVRPHSWIYKKLNISIFITLVGNLTSMSSNLILPFQNVTQQLNYENYFDKFNFVLHFNGILISIVLAFLVVSQLGITQQKIKDKLLRKNQQNNVLTHKLYWFFTILCNVWIPLTSISTFYMLFFVSNIFLFILGVYQAFKTHQFKCNNIILSAHLFFFHISFFGMELSTNYQQQQLFHIFSLFTFLFIFTGAVHEILSLLFQTVYAIVTTIKQKCKKIDNTKRVFFKQQIMKQKILKEETLNRVIRVEDSLIKKRFKRKICLKLKPNQLRIPKKIKKQQAIFNSDIIIAQKTVNQQTTPNLQNLSQFYTTNGCKSQNLQTKKHLRSQSLECQGVSSVRKAGHIKKIFSKKLANRKADNLKIQQPLKDILDVQFFNYHK